MLSAGPAPALAPPPVRYRPGPAPAQPPRHAPPPFVLYPDGRALAALRAVSAEVLQVNAVLAQVRTGRYSRKVERNRTHRVLHAMRRHGLVQLVPGLGWTATPAGRAAAERAALTGRAVAFPLSEPEIAQ